MVAILISTYNGETFLNEQLESIVNQETTELFQIFIRDDGSRDSTRALINEWKKNHPEIIHFLDVGSENIGTANSFDCLLKHANADYYFWCDQDDIWDSKKIHYTIERMKHLESTNSEQLPILIAHDMKIVNWEGTDMKRSFFSYTKLKRCELKNGLFQGFIPGCAMCMNHSAKQEYLRVPRTFLLHDFHSQLIIYLTGIIDKLDKPLTKYRIHSKNQIGLGEKKSVVLSAKDFLKYSFRRNPYRHIVLDEYSNIYNQLKESFTDEQLEAKGFYSLSQIKSLNAYNRKRWYLRHFKPFEKGYIEGLVRLWFL